MNELHLDKNKRYLLACSFGPDSMALFYLLKKSGYKFDAAIVNYHLREESDGEVSGLLNFAKRNGVKVYVYDNKITLNKNIEATCRKIRYDFFKELFSKNDYDALLVAHHQDDHIETYMLQKERQNSPIYYNICLSNNVPFAIDKTNADISIKRNRIRHQIVEKMNKSDREKILEDIRQENDELNRAINSIEIEKINSVNYLKSLDQKRLGYCLNLMVKSIDQSQSLSKANVGEILKVLNSKNPNVSSKLKKGLYFKKEYDNFVFSNSLGTQSNYSYLIKEPCVLDTPYFYLDFTGDTSNRNVKLSDYPLTIRTAKKEDHVLINGYEVSVRRLFIDWKVPNSLRNRWPLIVNKDNKVIYIPRYQSSFKRVDNINFYVK